MEYRYTCDVKTADIWKMAMRRTYKSFVGIINLVFTVAMILLTIRFWGASSGFIKSLMIFGCILFPVIQPLATYGMSAKQLEDMPRDMELTFNDSGVHVKTGDASEDIKWKKVKNAIKRNSMIVVMSDETHGYMLTNRVLGDKKEEFYEYLCSKIKG